MFKYSFFCIFIAYVVLSLAKGHYSERRGCRVVSSNATACDRSVPGVNCRDRHNLKHHLMQGTTQVMVCQSWQSSQPYLTDILVSLGMQWGEDCRTFLGVTSICHMPEKNESRDCECLAGLSGYKRTSCKDQQALRAHLKAENLTRICLLNPRVTPQVFVDRNVTLYPTLGCINGINVSGELCS